MGQLIYTGIASLDGYVADRDGNFSWSEPDREVHTFVNDLERDVRTYLYGRRMYQVMSAWETLGTTSELDYIQDYARIWQGADKVVYSSTLTVASTAKTRIERTFDPNAVRELKDAKLLGRGGAAFPTGVKWEAVATNPVRPHYVVCNADESEPGTFKDRVLMEEDPYALLEALTIMGCTCGAEQGYVYIRGEYPLAEARLLADLGPETVSANDGARVFVESDITTVLEGDADDLIHRDVSSARLDDRLRFLSLDVSAPDHVQREQRDTEGGDGTARA
jgi:hypothetical protein